MCDICQEPFEQFWEEDLEEWHFKDAIRPGDSKVSVGGGRYGKTGLEISQWQLSVQHLLE